MNSDRLLKRNVRLFYAVTALEYAFFNDAILILFGREFIGLNYFQAGSLFFIGWFVSIAFDFWGGVVADKIGRKQSTLLGLTLQLVSYLPFLLSRSYTVLLAGSVVWGVGVALSSNALHALIYEQVHESKGEGKQSYAHISATSQIWLFFSVGIATVIGGYAYKIDPRLPYGLITVTLLLAIILTWLIHAPEKAEEEVHEQVKTNIARQALRTFKQNIDLRNFIVISFLIGLFGDLLFAYYQPYFIDLKVSSVSLGILFGGLRVASAFGSYLMRTLPKTINPAMVQLLNALGALITAILLMIFKLPIVLLAPVIFGITSGFTEPNMRLFVNKHAENKVRASVLSFSTTTTSLGVGIGFVTAYFLADRVSARSVLLGVVAGLVVTIVLRIIYSRQKLEA